LGKSYARVLANDPVRTFIFDITRERIKRAATAIKNNSPLFTGDLGFKPFETIPVFEGYLDEAEELTENLILFDGSLLSFEERQVLLQTWAIHDGLPLHEVLTPIDLAGYTAYQASDILYFIEPNLNINTVICLLEKIDTTDNKNKNSNFAPRRLVL
jgi:adenine-specific DNA-methyltransferase